MLIVYGVAFIAVEQYNRKRRPAIRSTIRLPIRPHCCGLLPGAGHDPRYVPFRRNHSRAILLGMSRTVGAEFSFFLAIPTMVGASGLKILKFILKGATRSGSEWACLIVASVVAFVVSLLAIRSLMNYVKQPQLLRLWYLSHPAGYHCAGGLFRDKVRSNTNENAAGAWSSQG